MNWGDYNPYFSRDEFKCKHTGLCEMKTQFMDRLLQLRLDYGKPMTITSGYRHHTHPREAKKGHSQGEHVQGMCCDVAASNGRERFEVVNLAIKHGFHRIGIADRFVHIGLGGVGLPDRVIWGYD